MSCALQDITLSAMLTRWLAWPCRRLSPHRPLRPLHPPPPSRWAQPAHPSHDPVTIRQAWCKQRHVGLATGLRSHRVSGHSQGAGAWTLQRHLGVEFSGLRRRLCRLRVGSRRVVVVLRAAHGSIEIALRDIRAGGWSRRVCINNTPCAGFATRSNRMEHHRRAHTDGLTADDPESPGHSGWAKS